MKLPVLCFIVSPACEETLEFDWIANKSPNRKSITVDYLRSNRSPIVTYTAYMPTAQFTSEIMKANYLVSPKVVVLLRTEAVKKFVTYFRQYWWTCTRNSDQEWPETSLIKQQSQHIWQQSNVAPQLINLRLTVHTSCNSSCLTTQNPNS